MTSKYGERRNVSLDNFVKKLDAAKAAEEEANAVVHPKHYNVHPSNVECIEIVKHMNFCLGGAVKYIWRADHKGNSIEDLEKAIFLLRTEIDRREDETRSKEERVRESKRCKHSKNYSIIEPDIGHSNNEERCLSDAKHNVQYYPPDKDYSGV